MESLALYFDAWDTLKERFPKRLIVFTQNEESFVINDDAMDATDALGIPEELQESDHGSYWAITPGYRGLYMRQLQQAGYVIMYVDKLPETRAAKVRLPDTPAEAAAVNREIDAATGRVYVGRGAMGTFWWCPASRSIFMRGCGRWMGQCCWDSEWESMKPHLDDHRPLPAPPTPPPPKRKKAAAR